MTARVEHRPWPELPYEMQHRIIEWMRERALDLSEQPGDENRANAEALAAAATMLRDWV